MADDLEAPTLPRDLYRARGDETSVDRPVFTGDVFEAKNYGSGEPESPGRLLMVLQHPCALRVNGVDLVERLLVAQVEPAKLLPSDKWKGSYRVMPLPELRFDLEGKPEHHAAKFLNIDVVTPAQLAESTRIASLSLVGVNLLLQRWVHHNSRVAVGTHVYAEQVVGPFGEAELIEEWVLGRGEQGISPAEATRECHDFLREPLSPGVIRQDALEDPQRRAEVRRQARAQLKNLAGGPTTDRR